MARLVRSFGHLAIAVFALPLSAALAPTPTHASVILFDTLPPAAPQTTVDVFGYYLKTGQSFLSGPGGQLASVKLLLTSTNSSSTGSASIALMTSNSGTLGTVLASETFLDSIITSSYPSLGVYKFNPSSWTGSVTLASNTEYWIVLTPGAGGSTIGWGGNLDGTQGVGVAGTHFLFEIAPNGPVTYQSSVSGGTYNMQIESIAPVPEPSTYAMALAGLACGGYSLFRRRKRA